MRAFTCRSSRWPPQADSIKAANTMNPEGTVRLTMDVLVIDMRAMLHGGSLNIYFPGVDDLVLVGFGSLDGLALALLDMPEATLPAPPSQSWNGVFCSWLSLSAGEMLTVLIQV